MGQKFSPWRVGISLALLCSRPCKSAFSSLTYRCLSEFEARQGSVDSTRKADGKLSQMASLPTNAKTQRTLYPHNKMPRTWGTALRPGR